MAIEALLSALNDTLTDLLIRRDKINEVIKQRASSVEDARHCLKSAEDGEALAKLELSKIQSQLTALNTHIYGLREKPKAIQDKISSLSSNRLEARKKYEAATDSIAQAKTSLQTAQNQMELEENKLEDIQKQIQEVQNEVAGVSAL